MTLSQPADFFCTKLKPVLKCKDFAFETTLAGRSYLKLIDRLHHSGWRIELIYLALPAIEVSVARVAERVEHGGHDIPKMAIERRFARSLYNLFTEFSWSADSCLCFMNIGDEPILIFEQQRKQRTVIHDIYYQHLLKEAGL